MSQADMTPSGSVPPAPTGKFANLPGRVWFNDNVPMGFERPRPQRFRAGAPIGAERPFLGDYPELEESPYNDMECEHTSWPEMIDQTRLASACGYYAFEDAEEDDDDTCVTDGPHDEIDEEGI